MRQLARSIGDFPAGPGLPRQQAAPHLGAEEGSPHKLGGLVHLAQQAAQQGTGVLRVLWLLRERHPGHRLHQIPAGSQGNDLCVRLGQGVSWGEDACMSGGGVVCGN